MKSLTIHYMNKYPKGRVVSSDSSLDVYDVDGNHCVALRKNGAGMMSDVSEEMGCMHKHCLSPIPKESRLWKLKDGKISQDEKAEERAKGMEAWLSEDGHVLSCEELSKDGKMKFDESQKLKKD